MAVQSATYADIHLSEEDIKSRYIQPALEDKGWDKYHMRLEFPYTAGQIVVQGSLKHRKRGKRVDFLLYTEDNYPIAVVEAKDRKHAPADSVCNYYKKFASFHNQHPECESDELFPPTVQNLGNAFTKYGIVQIGSIIVKTEWDGEIHVNF